MRIGGFVSILSAMDTKPQKITACAYIDGGGKCDRSALKDYGFCARHLPREGLLEKPDFSHPDAIIAFLEAATIEMCAGRLSERQYNAACMGCGTALKALYLSREFAGYVSPMSPEALQDLAASNPRKALGEMGIKV